MNLSRGHKEQEEDNSSEEIEDENASKISKNNQDIKWRNQEGEPGLEVISNPKEMEKQIVSDTFLIEPTDDGDNASDTVQVTTILSEGEAFQEAKRANSNYYHIKYEKQRKTAHQNENVDTIEPREPQGVKKAESSPNKDESSREDNMRVCNVYSCINLQCKIGHMCKADQQGKSHCVCQDPMTCPPKKLLD